jgi:hypothetical protein
MLPAFLIFILPVIIGTLSLGILLLVERWGKK